MSDLGLEGARRGKKIRTTIRDDVQERAADLLQRDFTASRPNERWAADRAFSTWSGIVYVGFVVDVFSRAIMGWFRRHQQTSQARPRRSRNGAVAPGSCRNSRLPGLVHHSDASSHYTSFAFIAHLLDAGMDASIGPVGDALDITLMES
jgi:putative transposase